MLLYNAVTLFLIQLNGTTLSTYQGMDTIGQLNLRERLAAVPAAWKRFCLSFLRWPYLTPIFRLLHFAVLPLLAASNLFLAVREKLWKAPGRLALLVFGWLLIPLTLNFVEVLAYQDRANSLMTYSYVLFFVYAVKFAELAALRLPPLPSRRPLALYGAALLCCAVVAWNNFTLCNVGYHALTLNYENCHALANRIAGRIEALEGYTANETPLALVGSNVSSDFYGNSSYYTDFSVADRLMMLSGMHITRDFLNQYIGFHMPGITSSQRKMLLNNEEVLSMPVYPAAGSVRMIEGIAVVRLSGGEKIK